MTNFRKGYITDVETKRFYSFMFNPRPVQESLSWSFQKQDIPGRSHPHSYGGSGGGETLSFKLPLDGSRGRLEVTSYPDGSDIPLNRNLNVYLWIIELKAMLLPSDPNGTGAYGVPNRVFLNIPGTYSGEGRVYSLDIDYTHWHNNVLIRAEVNIAFESIRRSNLTSTQMLQGLSNDPLLPILF